MAKQIWKGGALLAPLPAVLITSGDMENSNIATVAWTGIVNTIPPKTYISLRKSRYSYELIEKSREFVINLTTAEMVRKVDYCGIYTGRKVDKFQKCGFTKEAASAVAAPLIGESPLSLECRVTDMTDLGTHVMLLADILATDVDETLVDADGKLNLSRAHLAAYAHGEYFALGKKIGSFGFSAKKKKKPVKKGK
ncbi:MAG: flavin reductase family protein [Clostridia bacterium]|nr:flavin reductase family protein [Clostridia bacterium]